MPFKTFAVGELATSADVNNYLMKQAVMVFADSSARSTAITSPTEGMVTYLTGTNAIEVYDGSSWVKAINTASLQDASVTASKLSGMYGVTYIDLGITMNTTMTWRKVTIPGGKQFSDVVSIVPWAGLNDVVYVAGVGLGIWSGVQTQYEVNLYCQLGNAVASTTGTVRFYFRA